MTSKEFNQVIKNRILKIENVLSKKSQEYSSEEDRFHNFKVAARIKNSTPEQALHGMMLKHEVSIMDLINYSETDPSRITQKLVDEKIGDMINYLILLEGMFIERINNKRGGV